MARVLLLTPTDLGETVLATGALAQLAGEGAAVTVVTSQAASPLFRAWPNLAALHVVDGAPWNVWLTLVRGRFDAIIDARGGVFGRTLPTRRRIALKPAIRVRHLVEDWGEATGADRPLAPKFVLDEAARAAAAAVAQDAALIVLAPGGAQSAKRWPPERFAAVARRLATGPLSNARVLALGAGARDAELTRAIVSSLDADGVAATDLSAARLDLLAAAALMERAIICIGNDNALTHIAAAMGAPTLTLFGPTDERVRAPFGPRTRTLRARSLEDIAAQPELDAQGAMEDVSIDAVEAAALELLHAGGLR
jgi:heptosyltransferase-3